jgi:hypothetical protein
MIIETLLTTIDDTGSVNCAPMGVEWGEDVIIVKPFLDTTTYRNLTINNHAVVNITDNVLLFAACAISRPDVSTQPAVEVRGRILLDVCSWRELVIEAVEPTEPRARLTGRVVHRGTAREFVGFNRARFAVLEAAILATRLHFMPRSQVLSDLARLQIIVDKTAGPPEREAMNLLTRHIQEFYENSQN